MNVQKYLIFLFITVVNVTDVHAYTLKLSMAASGYRYAKEESGASGDLSISSPLGEWGEVATSGEGKEVVVGKKKSLQFKPIKIEISQSVVNYPMNLKMTRPQRCTVGNKKISGKSGYVASGGEVFKKDKQSFTVGTQAPFKIAIGFNTKNRGKLLCKTPAKINLGF